MVAVAAWTILAGARPLQGAPDRDAFKKSSAAALVRKGNLSFDAKRFKEALMYYQAAARIYPSPKIEFNLAEAHRQLGHFALAEVLFERFLDEKERPSTVKFQQGAKARVEDMRQRGGRVAFKGEVESAKVAVDGGEVFPLPAHALLMPPGKHVFMVVGDGKAYQAFVDVKRGETATVEIGPSEPPQNAPIPAGAILAGLESTNDKAPPPEPWSAVVQPEPKLDPASASPENKALTLAAEPAAATSAADPPITEQWWFWASLSAAVIAGAAGVVAVRAHSGADEPGLGVSNYSMWQKR